MVDPIPVRLLILQGNRRKQQTCPSFCDQEIDALQAKKRALIGSQTNRSFHFRVPSLKRWEKQIRTIRSNPKISTVTQQDSDKVFLRMSTARGVMLPKTILQTIENGSCPERGR